MNYCLFAVGRKENDIYLSYFCSPFFLATSISNQHRNIILHAYIFSPFYHPVPTINSCVLLVSFFNVKLIIERKQNHISLLNLIIILYVVLELIATNRTQLELSNLAWSKLFMYLWINWELYLVDQK